MNNKQLIHNLQIALEQLALDQKMLSEKISKSPYDIQQLVRSYERDMADRWQFLSAILKEVRNELVDMMMEAQNENNK